MSREQGPHWVGMRPTANAACRRQRGAYFGKAVTEAAA